MKSVANSEPFLKPVDPVQFPAYKDYISCPMDLQVAVHHDEWSRGHSLSLPYMMTYILQQVKKNLIPISRAWSETSVESSTAARRRCSPIVNGFSTTASFSTRLPGAAEQNHNSKSHSKIGRSKTNLITLFKWHFPLSKLTSIAKGLVKVS